jgi:hypothetical protein
VCMGMLAHPTELPGHGSATDIATVICGKGLAHVQSRHLHHQLHGDELRPTATHP